MNDFKVGDRVKYVGENPGLLAIGTLTVKRVHTGWVDIEENSACGPLFENLRHVTPAPDVITIDRAELPEVTVSDFGNGLVTALAQENYQPQLRRFTEDGTGSSWNLKIAYANLAVALAIEARDAEDAAAEKLAEELITKRRDELAVEVAEAACYINYANFTYEDHVPATQRAIDRIIELTDAATKEKS